MVSSSSGDVARLLDVLQAEAPVGDVAAIRHVLLRRVGVNVDVERLRETWIIQKQIIFLVKKSGEYKSMMGYIATKTGKLQFFVKRPFK